MRTPGGLSPDLAELAVREKAVVLAREKLRDLMGPDRFEVALKGAEVAAAQAKVEDASEDLTGASIVAPFAGIISLVNADLEDNVNKESRVLEILDPTVVEVDGLVDALDVRFLKLGTQAKVRIASLPGQEFVGEVSRLAQNPRTERGVVTHPIRVAVLLPEGGEVPIRLSSAIAVLISEEQG